MLRIIRFELLKVLTGRIFWLFLLSILILNMFFLIWNQKQNGINLTADEIKSVHTKIKDMTEEEANKFINEQLEINHAILLKQKIEIEQKTTGDISAIQSYQSELAAYMEKCGNVIELENDYKKAEGLYALFEKIRSEIVTREKYQVYLDGIQNAADYMEIFPIFEENDFSKRNIKKTANDYGKLRNLIICYDINHGVRLLFDEPLTTVLILLFLLMVSLVLISDEKDRKLFGLIKSTCNGHGKTIVSKMAALFILCLFINLLIFMSKLVFAISTYGLGDITRSIQSVPELMQSVLPINIFQFIAYYLILRIMGMYSAALVMFFITLLSKNSSISVLLSAILGFTNVLLNHISELSAWNWLKYINLFHITQPYKVLSHYLNLNFFGYPVLLLDVFIIFLASLLIIMFVANFLFFIMKKGLENDQEFLKKILQKVLPNNTARKERYRTSQIFYEYKKVFMSNKILIILCAFILIQILSIIYFTAEFDDTDFYFKFYMTQLSGPLTKEKEDFILNEKKSIDHAVSEIKRIRELYNKNQISLQAMISAITPYMKVSDKADAFNMVYERYLYIKEKPEAFFMYDTGYRKLFDLSKNNEGLEPVIWSLVGIILCLSGIVSVDYKTGMYKILNTTPGGTRSTVKIKFFIGALIILVIFAVVFTTEAYKINQMYSMKNVMYPAASIPELHFYGSVPLLIHIVIAYLLRLLAFIGIMFLIYALSLLIKNNMLTAICCLLLFITPFMLVAAGMDFLSKVSLVPIFYVNSMFVAQPFWLSLVQWGVFAGMVAASFRFVYSNFGKML